MEKSPLAEVPFVIILAFELLPLGTNRAPFTMVMADVIADKLVVIMVPARAARICLTKISQLLIRINLY